jgi:flagellar basal body-associated protein FliL
MQQLPLTLLNAEDQEKIMCEVVPRKKQLLVILLIIIIIILLINI